MIENIKMQRSANSRVVWFYGTTRSTVGGAAMEVRDALAKLARFRIALVLQHTKPAPER